VNCGENEREAKREVKMECVSFYMNRGTINVCAIGPPIKRDEKDD
jgi:hypothetical protein